jgi:D-beta-D-heptose 7-phosphate kinase/D-beta-D-heptose 1-phosphate adenosyltransferase
MKNKQIMISGGFDPVHLGHVKMIHEASQWGDVIIVVNSDQWLKRKKGYVFMPWRERVEILGSFRGVSRVVGVNDSDGTVCQALGYHKPDAFANGGDRKKENTPEMELCENFGIQMLWNIGGEKIQSSSKLVESSKGKKDEFKR